MAKRQRFLPNRVYFPSISSSVVISLIFMWMFASNGIINQGYVPSFPATRASPGSTTPPAFCTPSWGCSASRATPWASSGAPRLAGITRTTIGTMMVIFLAALQNIPGQVYEAATVDGASTMQIFRKITIPLLRPTTFFVVTLGLIGTFQVFDQVYVISAGGPADTTLTIAYLVYRSGFDDSRMGLAAATAIVLFVIIFIFTLFQRRITGGDKAA
ncbi:MAG: sugar ABC transporter permease [Chloroflexi bacterium]|nr:sugar ABC transporter permease [Chloroflexota bacterium]